MRRGFILLTLLAAICCRLEGAAASPAEPVGSWVYPYFDELRLREGGPGFFLMTGPYTRLDLARWLTGNGVVGEPGTRSAWLRQMLAREFAPETALSGAGDYLVTCGAEAGLRLETDRKIKPASVLSMAIYTRQGIDLWTSFRTSANWQASHLSYARPWREHYYASFDQGGLDYRAGGLDVFIGRDQLAWGASRRYGLLLSGSAPSTDMVKLSLRGGRLLFTSLHSRLRSGPDDHWPSNLQRYLSAHRVEIMLGPRLDVSLSEVVIYGGYGRGFEWGYLNPLGAFYANQWNSDYEDNILVAADAALLLPGRIQLRAEIMADDFQIDPDSEPDKLAFGLNATALNPLSPANSMVGLAYYLATNRTYGHIVHWNRFTQDGKVMGFPAGPDGDRFEAWSSAAFGEAYLAKLTYVLARRGEGRVDDSQLLPGRALRFPSGTVESTHTVSAEFCWRPCRAFEVAAAAEWWKATNAGNIEGRDDDGLRLVASLTYDLRLVRTQVGTGAGR